MSAERIQRMMAVNVTGSILCARRRCGCRPARVARTASSSIFISAAKLGSPNTCRLCASKGAVDLTA
jgi:NAD(P)-dependent dehydrogenase (short-subunit alcohol dehydrogenase family)